MTNETLIKRARGRREIFLLKIAGKMAEFYKLKKKYSELDKEAGKYNRPEFGLVYQIISELTKGRNDVGDGGSLDKPLATGDVIDEALRRAGFADDTSFVADFKKYREIEQQSRDIQLKGIELMIAEQQRPEPQQVAGWRFMPISIYAPQTMHPLIGGLLDRDAEAGRGLFANVTRIADEDEALDALLMVDAYGLQCSFVPYLNELQYNNVAGRDEAFFDREATRQLFTVLKGLAVYLKNNTDRPQAAKNEIAKAVKAFDSVPIWGLFYQILTLQGLCRLLEALPLNEGDCGFIEAQSLYKWLFMQLFKKLLQFCMVPYSDTDRQQLKPLCRYLMTTEVGKLAQSKLFGEPLHEGGCLSLPDVLNTQKARHTFAKAIAKGWMRQRPEGGFDWLGFEKNGHKAKLAYLCAKVYGYQYTADRGNKGKRVPYEALEKLFGVTRLDRAMQQVFEAHKPQPWRRQIDQVITE